MESWGNLAQSFKPMGLCVYIHEVGYIYMSSTCLLFHDAIASQCKVMQRATAFQMKSCLFLAQSLFHCIQTTHFSVTFGYLSFKFFVSCFSGYSPADRMYNYQQYPVSRLANKNSEAKSKVHLDS